jgi:hypothetical protein
VSILGAIIPQEYSEWFNISLYHEIILYFLRCIPLPRGEVLLLINNTYNRQKNTGISTESHLPVLTLCLVFGTLKDNMYTGLVGRVKNT